MNECPPSACRQAFRPFREYPSLTATIPACPLPRSRERRPHAGRFFIAIISVCAFAAQASAQGTAGQKPGELSGLVKDIGELHTFINYGITFLVLFIGILILMFLYKKIASGKRSSEAPLLNLVEMKQKGLLTTEELAKVSHALKKQMETNRTITHPPGARSAVEILQSDPEVISLLDQMASPSQKASSSTQSSPESKETDLSEPASAKQIQPDQVQVQPALSQESNPSERHLSSTDENIGADTPLPPEVQTLIDSGQLTPEEIEQYKQRLLHPPTP